MIFFKVFPGVRIRGIQKTFQGEHGVGFAGAVGAFYPDREFLLPVKNRDRVADQFGKRFVWKELFPHIRVCGDNGFVYCRKVVRIYIKVMSVFIQ